MPIVFSKPNRHILLSDLRIAQVFIATIVQEATCINQMAEFVSRVIDWFRSGTHKGEIITLFNTLHESQHGAAEKPENRRREKFIQLRQLALPEYRRQFGLEVVSPAARFGWGYTQKANDQILYQCDTVMEKSNNWEIDPLPFFMQQPFA